MSEEMKTKVEEVTDKVEETKVSELPASVVETITEAKDTVVETISGTVEEVKECEAAEFLEKIPEGIKATVEAVTAPAVSKKATWWNRIWSAIVGAIMAVAATLGITSDQIAEQKAKTEEVKKLAVEALEYAKAGKIDDAKAALQLAVETGKETATEVKKVVDNVKDAKAEDLAKEAVKGAKEALKTSAETK